MSTPFALETELEVKVALPATPSRVSVVIRSSAAESCDQSLTMFCDYEPPLTATEPSKLHSATICSVGTIVTPRLGCLSNYKEREVKTVTFSDARSLSDHLEKCVSLSDNLGKSNVYLPTDTEISINAFFNHGLVELYWQGGRSRSVAYAPCTLTGHVSIEVLCAPTSQASSMAEPLTFSAMAWKLVTPACSMLVEHWPDNLRGPSKMRHELCVRIMSTVSHDNIMVHRVRCLVSYSIYCVASVCTRRNPSLYDHVGGW